MGAATQQQAERSPRALSIVGCFRPGLLHLHSLGAAPSMTAPPSSSAIFWTKDYITGLIFIVLVAIIWAASSVLVQYLYDDDVPNSDSDDYHFRSPFAVTYIGVSLFTLWLPTQKLVQSLREKMSSGENNSLRRRSSAMPYQALNEDSEDAALDDDGVSDHAARE